MSSASISQARVARLPLSSGMVQLLGSLMYAIDNRFELFQDVVEGNVDSGSSLRPTTCDCCKGLGFVLVLPKPRVREEPPESPTPEDDYISIIGEGEDDEGEDAEGDYDDDNDDNDDGIAPGPAVASTSAPTASTSAPVVVAGAPAPVPVAAAAPAPAPVVAAAAPAPAPVVAAAPAPAPVVAAAPAPAPVAAAAPAAQGGQAPVHPIGVPAPSPIIPGLFSFPATTPPPIPTEAVYCAAGGTRFYTITRGIRVGVYEGWQNVAPYVSGVANASFSRHGTIMAAYESYIAAYNRGFVAYA